MVQSTIITASQHLIINILIPIQRHLQNHVIKKKEKKVHIIKKEKRQKNILYIYGMYEKKVCTYSLTLNYEK
jgi:hypothetical protein